MLVRHFMKLTRRCLCRWKWNKEIREKITPNYHPVFKDFLCIYFHCSQKSFGALTMDLRLVSLVTYLFVSFEHFLWEVSFGDTPVLILTKWIVWYFESLNEVVIGSGVNELNFKCWTLMLHNKLLVIFGGGVVKV